MQTEVISGIVGAVSGAIAGGVISCVFNYLNDKRKERREDKKEQEKELQDRFEKRPEFKIIECYKEESNVDVAADCKVLNVVVSEFKASVEQNFVYANYAPEEFNAEERFCICYKLENVGKTDISATSLMCEDKRHFSLFSEYLANDLMKSRCLHYSAYLEHKIRVSEQFYLVVLYHKNHNYLPALNIGMKDSNGHFWTQQLMLPGDRIRDSRSVEYRDYMEDLETDVAEDCFKHPWLW